jgi:4-carboxymuconolactone decarboxylase
MVKEPVIMPRIVPIAEKSDVPAEYHAVVDGVLERFGRIRGPFSVLLHSPQLAEPLLGVGNYFLHKSIVAPKDRSLAILVATRQREGAYVWAAQVAAARRAGVREEAIDLIKRKGDPSELPAEERDIVTYARQLVETNRISQPAFDALNQHHDVQWMVELTVALNYYGFLSGVVSAFEVPVPPDGDQLPS